MEKRRNSLQKWMAAIAFAEAGEWETARQMAPNRELDTKISAFTRVFMAATFAEAGLAVEATAMADDAAIPQVQTGGDFLQNIGLSGIRMTYGIFAA